MKADRQTDKQTDRERQRILITWELFCLDSTRNLYFPSPSPSPAGVIGAPQMTSHPVSSIFLCSPLPPGTRRTAGLSIPWCCLPTSSSVYLVFFPLSMHCALQDGFGQTWRTGDKSIPLYFASLCLHFIQMNTVINGWRRTDTPKARRAPSDSTSSVQVFLLSAVRKKQLLKCMHV